MVITQIRILVSYQDLLILRNIPKTNMRTSQFNTMSSSKHQQWCTNSHPLSHTVTNLNSQIKWWDKLLQWWASKRWCSLCPNSIWGRHKTSPMGTPHKCISNNKSSCITTKWWAQIFRMGCFHPKGRWNWRDCKRDARYFQLSLWCSFLYSMPYSQ